MYKFYFPNQFLEPFSGQMMFVKTKTTENQIINSHFNVPQTVGKPNNIKT